MSPKIPTTLKSTQVNLFNKINHKIKTKKCKKEKEKDTKV